MNFFDKPGFGGNGMISGFRDEPWGHVSSFHSGYGNHVTSHYGNHDFSLETRVRLGDLNGMGALERRMTVFDALNNSPIRW
jgi:hypothetical protein